MEIKEITNKDIWENFLLGCGEKTFLQSWNWGEFQEKMGNKIWKLGLFDEENLITIVLALKIKAKRGTFLLVQHGPVSISNFQFLISKQIQNPKFQILNTLLAEFKKIAEKEKCDFIRMAPLMLARRSLACPSKPWRRWGEGGERNEEIFKDLGFRNSPMHANAYEATWKLDLSLPEEELLRNMRKTTRYLIRQAERNPDIEIERSERLSDVEAYQKLNREVAKRQNFTPFSDNYIKNEFEVFSKDNQALWLFGKYKGELAAGALIIFWSGIGFYHQAASLAKFAKFSIPYLLQWEAIKEAKRRGCKLYDFWGYVDPQKEPKHPWAGPTLFKMGFGGKAFEYVKTQDFPLSRKYWLIRIFEKLRKIKRGL